MDSISKIRLQQLSTKIKLLLFFTVLNLTFGVSIGLYYVSTDHRDRWMRG